MIYVRGAIFLGDGGGGGEYGGKRGGVLLTRKEVVVLCFSLRQRIFGGLKFFIFLLAQ